jgi:hypothetical protein
MSEGFLRMSTQLLCVHANIVRPADLLHNLGVLGIQPNGNNNNQPPRPSPLGASNGYDHANVTEHGLQNQNHFLAPYNTSPAANHSGTSSEVVSPVGSRYSTTPSAMPTLSHFSGHDSVNSTHTSPYAQAQPMRLSHSHSQPLDQSYIQQPYEFNSMPEPDYRDGPAMGHLYTPLYDEPQVYTTPAIHQSDQTEPLNGNDTLFFPAPDNKHAYQSYTSRVSPPDNINVFVQQKGGTGLSLAEAG